MELYAGRNFDPGRLKSQPVGSYGYQWVRTLYNCTQRMEEGGEGVVWLGVSNQDLLSIHSSQIFSQTYLDHETKFSERSENKLPWVNFPNLVQPSLKVTVVNLANWPLCYQTLLSIHSSQNFSQTYLVHEAKLSARSKNKLPWVNFSNLVQPM